MFRRVAIVGCGLIGGSFALALRAAKAADLVVGFDRDASTAQRARSLGIVDRIETRLEDAVAASDLVLVAAPVAQAAAIFGTIATALAPHAIVTDTGSTKRDVVAAARRALGAAVERFVPGHPIAGRELHGPDAADAALFRDRRVLLTPLPENGPEIVAAVCAAWTACGARVQTLGAEEHDLALSSVSHLPHLLAFALVGQIADASDAALKFGLAGSGFRDFTRIAASSPEMWRDIAVANRDALMGDLDAYRLRLDAIHRALATDDRAALEALFTRASVARKAWTEGR
jgi:prephenate dehydrogenase